MLCASNSAGGGAFAVAIRHGKLSARDKKKDWASPRPDLSHRELFSIILALSEECDWLTEDGVSARARSPLLSELLHHLYRVPTSNTRRVITVLVY